MKFAAIITFFILGWSNIVQSQNIVLEFPLEQKRTEFGNYQQTVDISGYDFKDFIAISLRIEGNALIYEGVRVKVQSKDSLYILKHFHEEVQEGKFVSELIYLPVTDASELKLVFDYNSGVKVEELTGLIRIFSPGGSKTETKHAKKKSGARDFSDCDCPQPDYVTRSSWGSGFGLNENIYIPPAAFTDVTHLIIHHSAGTNSSSNWPGVVASIFDFHVNTNGWQDVGYNWLIDPNGIIYEGRGGGDNVRGAHMCGYNNNTMGVCIMGNFTSVPPSQISMVGLKTLLAWKCCKEAIDPMGSGLKASYSGFMKNISGHKDGCSPNYTECPGVVLYSFLDSIRTTTNDHIDTLCSYPSGFENDFLTNLFLLYPNPVMEYLQIENLTNIQIVEVGIFDSFGRIINSKHIFDKSKFVAIDLHNLSNGFYYIKIKTSDGIFVKKITRFQ